MDSATRRRAGRGDERERRHLPLGPRRELLGHLERLGFTPRFPGAGPLGAAGGPCSRCGHRSDRWMPEDGHQPIRRHCLPTRESRPRTSRRSAPPHRPDRLVGAAQGREASGAFPRNQGFEPRSNDRGLLSQARQLRCPSEQGVVDVQRCAHSHHDAFLMHTSQRSQWSSVRSRGRRRFRRRDTVRLRRAGVALRSARRAGS